MLMGSWVHGFICSWVHGFMGSWVATGGNGRQREATGGNGRQREATGGNGRQREATGGNGRRREATGGNGRQREATGGDGRQREATGGNGANGFSNRSRNRHRNRSRNRSCNRNQAFSSFFVVPAELCQYFLDVLLCLQKNLIEDLQEACEKTRWWAEVDELSDRWRQSYRSKLPQGSHT